MGTLSGAGGTQILPVPSLSLPQLRLKNFPQLAALNEAESGTKAQVHRCNNATRSDPGTRDVDGGWDFGAGRPPNGGWRLMRLSSPHDACPLWHILAIVLALFWPRADPNTGSQRNVANVHCAVVVAVEKMSIF